MAPARFVQRGASVFSGGFIGLKPIWQKPQAIPMRYGGSILPGLLKYASAFQLALSNLGFGKRRKPTIPVGSPGTVGTGGCSH